MIGMYISYFLATYLGIDPLASLIVAMPILFVVGVLLQHFLIRRVLGLGDMPQIFLHLCAVAAADKRHPAAVHGQFYRTVQTSRIRRPRSILARSTCIAVAKNSLPSSSRWCSAEPSGYSCTPPISAKPCAPRRRTPTWRC